MSEVLTNGIKVPDKGSRSWYDDMRGDLIKLDALIGSASSVTVNPMLTSGIEIASITVNGKSYSLYQQDGDIAVNIKPVTTNEELPILLSKSAEENTDTVDMAVGVTVNPNSNSVTATTFVGALSGNATTATKATQDASGNNIATTYAKVNNLALVATSGSYTDLTNKPTIPTVNNATLTIQKNGTTVKTFSANASANTTANITVPTKTSDLTNDNGYITNTNDCVHLTGDESIDGTKRFDSPNNIVSFAKRITDYATEDTPTRNVYQHLAFQDKNNKNIALIQYSSRTSNVRDLGLYISDASGSLYGIQINTNKEVIPATNNSYSLGSSSNWWNSAYINSMVSANITLSDPSFLRCTYGSYGTFWRQDYKYLYLMLTNKNDQYGAWTADRPIQVDLASGVCNINGNAATATKATQDASGNVITDTYATKAKNAIVLAFCASAVNNGSTVAGTTLKVANGGTGGAFTATTETLTGTYRALNTVVANGVGMFVKIA